VSPMNTADEVGGTGLRQTHATNTTPATQGPKLGSQ